MRSPTASWPSRTKWPPYQSTATRASVGMKSTSGRKLARSFALARACSSTLSVAASSRLICSRSVPKPFTARTPATLSSTTLVSSLSRSWSCVDTGPTRRANRVAATFRNGRAPNASRVRDQLWMNITTATPISVARGDAVRQHHDGLVHLQQVGVGERHQVAGLCLVVEREVLALEVGEERRPEIRLDPIGEPERAVAAHCRAPHLHEADHDDGHGVANAGGLVPGDDPVVDCVRGEQRDHDARSGEHQGRADARDEPGRMGDEQPAQEPPATPA